MKRIFTPQSKIVFAIAALVFTVVFGAGAALAQSGHFLGDVTCEDLGTQLQCCGKVAGLGGTTFEITLSSAGATASVVCTNPGGNVAPGQNTTITATGTSGPLSTPRNGQFRYCVTTATPTVSGATACPNASWTAAVSDVTFTEADLTLSEDGTTSDTTTGTIVP
jgi:hypothetical protein